MSGKARDVTNVCSIAQAQMESNDSARVRGLTYIALGAEYPYAESSFARVSRWLKGYKRGHNGDGYTREQRE